MNAALEVVILPVSDPDKSLDFYRDKLGFYLVVDDIAAVRDELVDRGVGVSSIRHKDVDNGQWQGRYHLGVDPQRADYASFADVTDPDGNTWVLQERGHRPASAS